LGALPFEKRRAGPLELSVWSGDTLAEPIGGLGPVAVKKSKIVRLHVAEAAVEPLLRDILEAIASHGGAAHRDMVIRTVVNSRAGGWSGALDALRDQIIGAFDGYIALAGELPAPHPYASLPFGPGSRRWALTDSGRTLFVTAARSSAA
jgi:hypothetical protein